MSNAVVVYTIGHSTRSAEDFVTLLQAHGVKCLADIRTVARSRHNPQFNEDALASTLAAHAIRYVRLAGLGGFRRTSPDSPNTGWRNLSFRGYADYMQTPAFAQNLGWLITLAHECTIAIMCAEAVPWRCHRSLVADALLVHGIPTCEIVSETKATPHRITPFAKVDGESITYPAAQGG